jgi:two-component system OmpR family response regulator
MTTLVREAEDNLNQAEIAGLLQHFFRNAGQAGQMPAATARILVVEDEALLRESVAGALSQAGFVVQAYEDGRNFADRVSRFRPDAAVLDVMLPGPLNGFSLARQLRNQSTAAIVFLTARDGIEDRLSGFDAGADDYIVKPFVLAELVARLRAVLRRTGRLVSSTVEVGDLVVDEDSGLVLRSGREIALTATELRLLAYLARNRDRVLSKTQILTQVWGYEDYDPNLVETFISALRRKLDRGPDDRLIHTVRGVGYRMTA